MQSLHPRFMDMSRPLRSNPLCLPISQLLQQAEQGMGLYDLLKQLEADGVELEQMVQGEMDAGLSSELMLFRKNFILMNALYEIQRDLQGSGYGLHITPLKILLYKLHKDNSVDTTEDGLSALAISEAAASDLALSEYYLNWQHYADTDQAAVEQLLQGFWQCYQHYHTEAENQDKRSCALAVLGLKCSASWDDIQYAYRQKVACCHPDRGGQHQHFIEVREAYQFLKLSFSYSS
ncbi:MAG TPA: DNA-J related domain-containing protein [Gammaproteobacteria bacterium]